MEIIAAVISLAGLVILALVGVSYQTLRDDIKSFAESLEHVERCSHRIENVLGNRITALETLAAEAAKPKRRRS